MPYSAEINRKNPTAFLFAIDRSGSMAERTPQELSKAQMLADVMNRLFSELILKCTRSEGVRHYFDIGVIGYDTTLGILNPLPGHLQDEWLNPVGLFESNPLRVEQRRKKVPDGAGGVVEITVPFPVWFDPVAEGGTPMCEALTTAYQVLEYWCATHPDAYPPLFVHITDGESGDGDPQAMAAKIRSLKTNDGNVLIFNVHLSRLGGAEVLFPASEDALPDAFARMLFAMSSVLPERLVAQARNDGFKEATSASRGFAYQVSDLASLVAFLDIGTRAAIDVAAQDR